MSSTSRSSRTENSSDEDMYILLEVTGIIDSEALLKNGSCRILGLTTANPILQIGNNVFTGEYKETIGTMMFFEENDEQEHNNDEPSLGYICKADRKLELHRIILKPKKPLEEPKGKDGTSDTSTK